LANLAKAMQMLIVSWQVYDLVRSPLALGFIGLAEGIPFLAVGLWAGHAADRYEKKAQIVGAVGGLFVCSLAFVFLSLSSKPQVIPVYIVLAMMGFLSSFEFTSSNAYVQTLIPKEEFKKAASWTLVQYQTTIITGPLIGGWVLSKTNVEVGYSITAGLFFLAMMAAWSLKPLGVSLAGSAASGWENIKSGIKFLLSRRLIVACMTLDMVAVLFGDVIAILPVFAAMFQKGPFGLGLLRAAPAIGSWLLSFTEANRPFLKINWKNFLITVSCFGLSLICFGLSKNFYLSVFLLMLSGAADGVSVIIRQSVFQAFTPDPFRGRVASVNSIFIRISNEIGAFESGLAAYLIGTVPSVLFGGAMTLAAAFFMGWKFRNLGKEGELP
jgi:MFS family permease